MLTTNEFQTVSANELAQIDGGFTPLHALAAGIVVGVAVGMMARSGFKAEFGEDGQPIEEDYKGGIVLK